MKQLSALTKRSAKLYFKDKGMFFTSLITPLILLVLYSTFLADVYRSAFTSNLPESLHVSEALINGCVGSQLFSSLLAVSCITVAFCSNMILVQDKVTGARRDLTITPVRPSTLALSYYLSTVAVTLLVCLCATGICFIYLAVVGWYLTVADTVLVLLDVCLLVLFGTALSSVINFFLHSQGQISAVGTIISAGYGFICGAYMPITSFSEGLQKVLSFLPGTYATVLLRSHAMHGVFAEMAKIGIPSEIVTSIQDSIDCNFYFFGTHVATSTMYLILCGTIVLLILVYILLHLFRRTAK